MAAVQDFLPGSLWQIAVLGLAVAAIVGGLVVRMQQRKKAGL